MLLFPNLVYNIVYIQNYFLLYYKEKKTLFLNLNFYYLNPFYNYILKQFDDDLLKIEYVEYFNFEFKS